MGLANLARSQVELCKMLGEGEFGKVYRANVSLTVPYANLHHERGNRKNNWGRQAGWQAGAVAFPGLAGAGAGALAWLGDDEEGSCWFLWSRS